MITEADTCRKYVLPQLYGTGWSDDQINEQKTFTDGKIIVIGDRVQRGKHKRADYILRISRNFPLAVIEAKAAYKKHGDGLQQAKEYAEILGLKFAQFLNLKSKNGFWYLVLFMYISPWLQRNSLMDSSANLF